MILRCATSNAGKLREFQRASDDAAPGRFEIRPLDGLKHIAPPDETGTTFEENAGQKALYYSGFTPDVVLAEDSGIEVAALGGAPGVYSARFAGPDADDAANNALLIERLAQADDRAARYVSVIALAQAGSVVAQFRGEVAGQILTAPRGSGGFGYDPLFFYPPFGCTFGEAPLEEKMKVSHRANALAKLFTWLGNNAAR